MFFTRRENAKHYFIYLNTSIITYLFLPTVVFSDASCYSILYINFIYVLCDTATLSTLWLVRPPNPSTLLYRIPLSLSLFLLVLASYTYLMCISVCLFALRIVSVRHTLWVLLRSANANHIPERIRNRRHVLTVFFTRIRWPLPGLLPQAI